MRLWPIGENVLVIAEPVRESTEGGIVLPDIAKARPVLGRVLAAGEKCKENLATGDRVIWDTYSGIDVESDGAKCMIMPEKEIMVVLAH